MLAIPGFESPKPDVLRRFGPAVEPITPATAIEIASTTFELDVLTVARLDTERDDTFRIRTPTRDLTLKIAHPGEDPASIDLQTKALLHAQTRDAGLPLQHLLEVPGGGTSAVLVEYDDRIARAFTWLPGTVLEEANPTDVELVKLGEALGRLSTALRGFEHHAAEYPLAWDLAQAQKLRSLSEREPDHRTIEALDRHENVVLPLLRELPRQVIHNDFNLGNVVVDPSDEHYVVGILDFGDVIHSVRVADLAIALSYFLFPLGKSWEACAGFIEGFERRVLLVDIERRTLKTLVTTRLVQRILIGDWLAAQGIGRRPDPLRRAGLLATLEQLLDDC